MAHYRVTGRRYLLDAARRWADVIRLDVKISGIRAPENERALAV